MNAKEAIAEARYIVSLMKAGAFTYDEAKEKCEPLFKIANDKGKQIAKKYNRKYSPITFTPFAR